MRSLFRRCTGGAMKDSAGQSSRRLVSPETIATSSRLANQPNRVWNQTTRRAAWPQLGANSSCHHDDFGVGINCYSAHFLEFCALLRLPWFDETGY